ncbi:tripartite tricarboxylate transporter substrate binding protein [Ramlibacter sp. WS9]|uniref:Bug family tripartite tricarboxylate transporter substrate binding protein n=1 Tax=Ramlibacter sp. WS9 TaxID=1882741 RepID=UPI001143563E|nr:tripartite tricarboxylate transporter substrate-binding protein [Ramlibacter sp. WS9]ROZ77477.1 tripartite tricarboxylate transporter substrate binding protein [Ramlibacter sp. WS9]
MQRRQLLAWGSAALAASPSLFAQGKYPQRPITLVVPTAPGGSTDFTARLVSDQLARALGQPVVVDNKPGASGNIGNQLVARAKPDGYTLLVSYSGYHVGNPHLFKQLTGTFITHIPYKGSGPAVQDLMGGQVDLFITTPAGVVSQIQAGRLNALAVTSRERLSSLPQVPTAAESGIKGYDLDSWFALYAPAGTPADVVQLLNAEVGKILASPEVRRKAEDSGTAIELMAPAQLGEFTKKELDYWGRVIKGARITLE